MIVIIGATGKTGSQTAHLLLSLGKKIRVVGRSEERLKQFGEKGAEIAAGDLGNETFFTQVLSNADAAYILIPPKLDTENVREYYDTMGDITMSAIKNSGIKKIVFLSSLGAELESGTGPVVGLHDVEQKLRQLESVDIAILRPGYFMENFMMNIPLIKEKHINGGTSKPDTTISMIATRDIASKAAELLSNQEFTGHSIHDLFGDIVSNREITNYIREAIRTDELPYIQFSDEDTIETYSSMGLSKSVARSFVELSHAFDEGKVHATQVDPQTPNVPVRFTQFVKEVFEPAYQST